MGPTLREQLDALSPEQRAELLARLRGREASNSGDDQSEIITPLPPGSELPLSHAQQRLWFLDQIMEHRPVYHTPVVLRMRGPLSADALTQSLTALVTRHAVLRTRLVRDHQVVDPSPAAVPLPVEDLSRLDAAEREQLMAEYIESASVESFDLAAAPPLRACLWRFADTDHVFGLFLHHVVMDDWSVPLLINELVQSYQAALSGTEPALPHLPVQYADYAVWQRRRLAGPLGERQSQYWARQLAGMRPTELPADRPRPRKPTWAGETITSVSLPPELAARLTEVYRGPLLTVLATVLNAVLTRWTGSTDVAIGTAFSGRNRPDLEPLIGFFTNTVVLRTDTSGNPTLETLLERTAETIANAYANQELPFDQVAIGQRLQRLGPWNPLFHIMLVMSDAPFEAFSLGELRIEPCEARLGTSRFDLMLRAVRSSDGGLALNAEYSTELFGRARISRLLDDLRAVLDRLATALDTRLDELPLAGPLPGVLTAEPEIEDSPSDMPESWSPVGQIVADLWCTTLGASEVRPDDNFFGLGGGSIQAVSLITQLKEQFEIDFDLGDFFVMSTLAAMVNQVEAALLEDIPDDLMKTANERPELIVTLRAGDNRQIPVFFVHPSGGSCMSYAALCREMPPGIPCFGIESLGLDGGELPRSVDEMAEAYAAAIQAAHPEGPYHLMGWSAGGGLAYATAVRLRRQGREVGLLAMLDTPPPPVLPQAPDASVLRVLFAENFSLTVGLQPTDLSAADLAALDDVAQIEKVISALVESGMVPDESTQMLRWRMAVFVAITSAVTVWRPEHYDGRIDLFHTAASPESAAAKWSGLTSGQLVVHEAPGDHYSMTSPPHVAELGRVLGKLLEGSLRATG